MAWATKTSASDCCAPARRGGGRLGRMGRMKGALGGCCLSQGARLFYQKHSSPVQEIPLALPLEGAAAAPAHAPAGGAAGEAPAPAPGAVTAGPVSAAAGGED